MKSKKFSLLAAVLLAASLTHAQTYWVIHGFSGSEASPNGVVVSDGTMYGTTMYGGGFLSYGNVAGNWPGAVFRVNTDGSGYQVLKRFNGADGLQPHGKLVLSNTTLYGTTTYGGSSNNGTVFSINIDGSAFKTIKSFTGGSDGASPYAGLVLSGATLYGTTYSGGISNAGVVFKLNLDGTGYTVIKSFTGNDGANPVGELIFSDATLYGTTGGGGSTGHGTVFKVNTDGSGFITLHSFSGTNGSQPYARLALSGAVLCGTTYYGGISNAGVVYKIGTNGGGFNVLKSFSGMDGRNPLGGLISSGVTVYGTTESGGSSNSGTVFQINSDGTAFSILKNLTGSDGRILNSTLTLSGVTLYGTTPDGDGTNDGGVVFGLALPTLEPTIAVGPRSQAVQAGSTIAFTVRASGTGTLAYQWFHNGASAGITGTDATLQLTNIQPSQAGSYAVVITNTFGAVTSGPVQLDVILSGTLPVASCTEAGIRAALEGSSTVDFACDGTITLANTIEITKDTVIDGSSHQVTISGGGLVRVFSVSSNVTFTILNLTILNGVSSNGGAIYNDGGTINATGCTFVASSAIGRSGTNSTGGPPDPGQDALGGAIYNLGVLNADLCTFTQNSAFAGPAGLGPAIGFAYTGGPGGRAGGGAICNFGALNISRSTLAGNIVAGGAGGSGGAALSSTGSSGTGGIGGWGYGGAIFNGGLVRLTDCALTWNTGSGGTGGNGGAGGNPYSAGGTGGMGSTGVGAIYGSFSSVNCTFAGNTGWGGAGGSGGMGYPFAHTASPGGAGGPGGIGLGGIQTSGTLTNCTIGFNLGIPGGGGQGGGGQPNGTVGSIGSAGGGISGGTLINTLLASNSPANNYSGTLTDLGHNLSSDATCAFAGPGSLNNIDARLGPLTNNGGPTLTIALLPASPAIDAANSSSSPPTDQRGFPRPAGAAADIGALEYGSMLPVLVISRVDATVLNITAYGNAGQACRLFTSPDLLNWLPIATNQIAGDGTVVFQDYYNPGKARLFYRLAIP